MMDITAILHMHAELSLTAVFILMFLLDLFLPAPQRHWCLRASGLPFPCFSLDHGKAAARFPKV